MSGGNMKSNQTITLRIEALPVFSINTGDTATEIAKQLMGEASVSLINKDSVYLATRGLPADQILQIISITFTGVGLILKLVKLLKEIMTKSSSTVLLISCPENNERIKIIKTDSLNRIEKKLRRLLKTKSIQMSIKK
jgi:hypothetical protein